MILYHPYAEALLNDRRLAATWAFLEDTEPLLSPQWAFVHQACGPDTRYEDGLKALWGQDDLVILEHDLVPTLEVLAALEPARHPLCAQAYPLYHDGQHGKALDEAWAMAQRITRDSPQAQQVYDLCAQAYVLWHQSYRPNPSSPRRYFATCAHRTVDAQGQHHWVDDGQEWADLAGFGLLRITKAFQQAHAPGWREGPWNNLDTRFSEWVYGLGIPFHVHWPEIPHHHHCPCHEQEG